MNHHPVKWYPHCSLLFTTCHRYWPRDERYKPCATAFRRRRRLILPRRLVCVRGRRSQPRRRTWKTIVRHLLCGVCVAPVGAPPSPGAGVATHGPSPLKKNCARLGRGGVNPGSGIEEGWATSMHRPGGAHALLSPPRRDHRSRCTVVQTDELWGVLKGGARTRGAGCTGRMHDARVASVRTRGPPSHRHARPWPVSVAC
ncbi:hypothetical protein BD413DRAFT_502893 [Trametes elegans]|nr:hypothetical protein BD413DRAFT_502893 [Trametes elegans]